MFRKIATIISNITGSSMAFVLAVLLVGAWALTGPIFDFSNTWQLLINTGTTIMTFLMVFLIQNTQNRDSKAMQLKLDELIRSTRARDAFVDLEELSDEEMAALDKEFRALHEKQISSPTMKKLHSQLQASHRSRTTSRGQHALDHINPLHHDKPK